MVKFSLYAASATPFASAVINNAGHLVMVGATAGFANTVIPVIEWVLSGSIGSNNGALVGKATTSSDATGLSLVKGLATTLGS